MMAEPRGESYLRFERETRLASWVIYLGCTAWVVWVGATRWNAVPDGAALSIDPDLDRTRELVAALEALPPDPPLSFPPAPEGMSWAPGQRWWDAVSIRAGEWSPATRPDQYTAMKHFQTAEVTRALSMLAAVEPGGWRVEIPWLSGMCRAASLLAMRARYRQAERGDVDAALADLRATLRLAGLNHRSRRVVGILTAFGSPALGELRQLSRERALSRKQACGTVEVIRSELPERDEGWSLMIDAEFASMFQVIGACYTREGDGGGWLVLNRMDYALYSMSEPRYGAWNLLSVVFNDRGAVLAKIKPTRCSMCPCRDRISTCWTVCWSMKGRRPKRRSFTGFQLVIRPTSEARSWLFFCRPIGTSMAFTPRRWTNSCRSTWIACRWILTLTSRFGTRGTKMGRICFTRCARIRSTTGARSARGFRRKDAIGFTAGLAASCGISSWLRRAGEDRRGGRGTKARRGGRAGRPTFLGPGSGDDVAI